MAASLRNRGLTFVIALVVLSCVFFQFELIQ